VKTRVIGNHQTIKHKKEKSGIDSLNVKRSTKDLYEQFIDELDDVRQFT